MKALKIIRSAAVWLVVALAAGMMIFTVVSVSTFDRSDRSLFGYKAFIVLSDSMSKTDFNAGDLVLVREVEPASLKEGDIIAYTSQNTSNYGETVTHKIRRLTTDANGEIIIENLRIDGEYVVSEVSDDRNADYILPEDKTAAVIEGSVTIVEMHNERKPEPEVPDSPQTGDNSNLPLWFGLMGLSGASLIGIALYSRKRRREEM